MMSGPTIKITDDQRAALYHAVMVHLSGLEDVLPAIERDRDYEVAARIGRGFAEDLRLLDDLGWDPDDDRRTVPLTMSAEELLSAARRIRDEAQGALDDGDNQRRRDEAVAAMDRHEAARDAGQEIVEFLVDRGFGS